MVFSFRKARKPRPQGRSLQSTRIPIPQLGVNSAVPLSRMPADYLPYAFNIYSSEEGMLTRMGHKVHAKGLATSAKTLVAYHAESEDGSKDKLFAVNNGGIYDISTSTDTPTEKVAFSVNDGRAGWAIWTQYTNDSGAKKILLADGANGLHVYDAATDTWALETGVTGIDEADVRFVMTHKLRVWLAVEDSAEAYYLPAGAYTGGATAYNFARNFPNGGYLVGMWSWTIDGGAGSDDYFVAVASSGDVVVYQGTDPSSASTWALVGQWNIGRLPVGRNIAANIGGELHLLSTYGVISLNDLIRGVDTDKLTGQNSIAKNVVLPIRADMRTRSDNEGWQFIHNLPNGFVMITRPIVTKTDTAIQYVLNLATNAWSFFRGLPIQCGVSWLGNFYFGDLDGNVHVYTGSLDGVDINGDGGTSVEFSMCTAFSDLGAPGAYKFGQFLRPTFIVDDGALPSYNIKFVYDYNLREITNTSLADEPSGALWDTAVWDVDIWGGQDDVGFELRGGTGMGRMVAVALKGSANSQVRLIDLEAMWRTGWVL